MAMAQEPGFSEMAYIFEVFGMREKPDSPRSIVRDLRLRALQLARTSPPVVTNVWLGSNPYRGEGCGAPVDEGMK